MRSDPGLKTGQFDWEGHKVKGNRRKDTKKVSVPGQESARYNTRGR